MNRQFFSLLFVVIFFCSQSARADQSSFVADAVQKAPGQEVRRGKLYVSPLGTRFEFTVEKQKVIQIIQPSRGLFWLLFPDTKTYFEVKTPPARKQISGRNKSPCDITDKQKCRKEGLVKFGKMSLERWVVGNRANNKAIEVWWDPVRHMYIKQLFPNGSKMIASMSGSRQFEGLLVEQWKMTVTLANGSKNYSYMLFAPDLGFPIMEQGSKGLVKELHNVKPYPQDAALYDLPDGYKKIGAPLKRPR
ncbi:MAG: hypothetical protein GY927_13965 [bacterium]|nr:hypothetical protein [bacterium]